MDNYMDTLAQKMTAQELIRANVAAEAAEAERLKTMVTQYNSQIEEMKANAARTDGSLEDLKTRFQDMDSKMGSLQQHVEDSAVKTGEIRDLIQSGAGGQDAEKVGETLEKNLKQAIEERMTASDANTHETGVRIYRNVQAAMQAEQKKKNEELTSWFSENQESLMNSMLGQLEEQLSRTGVSTNERLSDLDKRFDALNEKMKRNTSSQKILLIITLVVAALSLAANLLGLFGIL